ncbi:hypothetical protein J6590_044922 [Homalodisca vitripennis]|nr:hypothetical protein J6590_044922 [Homalodisca vitripennis]
MSSQVGALAMLAPLCPARLASRRPHNNIRIDYKIWRSGKTGKELVFSSFLLSCYTFYRADPPGECKLCEDASSSDHIPYLNRESGKMPT